MRDYFNQTLLPFLQKEGIVHYSSYVKYNGVVERKNRHLRLHEPFCFKQMFLNLSWEKLC